MTKKLKFLQKLMLLSIFVLISIDGDKLGP